MSDDAQAPRPLLIASAITEAYARGASDAYRAGTMAVQLMRAGLPYVALVERWTIGTPDAVRNNFYRGVDDA